MPKNHLKSIIVPRTWLIKRKENTFITRPKPGAHSFELGLPISVILRQLLGKAKTAKECRSILKNQEVLINGKRKKNHRYLVGLLDIISFPEINEFYVVLINKQNILYLQSITKAESEAKLAKVMSKSTIKGGITQLHTLDGRTIRVKKDVYKTGNTLLLSVPSQEIKNVFKLEKDTPVLLYKGRHVGKIGVVVNTEDQNLIFRADGEEFQTKRSFALSIGKDKPIIKIK